MAQLFDELYKIGASIENCSDSSHSTEKISKTSIDLKMRDKEYKKFNFPIGMN
jgi:hypothetical protein